nr:Chain B, TYR-LEU-GLY-ALA-ASN-GLY [Haemophilus influenzae 86-028NP]
YLGANG